MKLKRVLAALTAFFCLTALISCTEDAGDPVLPLSSETTSEQSSEVTPSETEEPSSEESTESPSSEMPTVEPESSSEAEPSSESTSSESGGTTYSGKLSSEQLEAFSQAAFVGNSVMDGFNCYNIVPTADCYTRTSLSVFNIDSRTLTSGKGKGKTVMKAIDQNACGKTYSEIYVLFGINETSYSLTKFADNYAQVVENLKAAQPEATIYVFSIFPVTKAKSDKNESSLTNKRVNEMNAELKAMCAEHGAVYLDIHSKLADENGVLPASNSSDGIHLKRNAYYYVAECVYDMVYAG